MGELPSEERRLCAGAAAAAVAPWVPVRAAEPAAAAAGSPLPPLRVRAAAEEAVEQGLGNIWCGEVSRCAGCGVCGLHACSLRGIARAVGVEGPSAATSESVDSANCAVESSEEKPTARIDIACVGSVLAAPRLPSESE